MLYAHQLAANFEAVEPAKRFLLQLETTEMRAGAKTTG